MKEEMYEEEEDDLPRQYRALAAHLQTSSSEMNHRLSAYLTNQVAMASLARQQEVNRLFAEQFPNASQVSHQLAQSAYYQPLQTGPVGQGSPTPPDFAQMGLPIMTLDFQRDRSLSIPHSSGDISSRRPSMASDTPSPARHQGPFDDMLSPPALTPGSGSTETPQSHSTPTFAQAQAAHSAAMEMTIPTTGLPIDPSLSAPSSIPVPSSFTAELPTEAKMLANLDMNDPLTGVFLGSELMGSDGLEFSSYGQSSEDSWAMSPQTAKQESLPPSEDYFNRAAQQPTKKLLGISGQLSRIGTPGGGVGDAWDSWVHTDKWGSMEIGDEDH